VRENRLTSYYARRFSPSISRTFVFRGIPKDFGGMNWVKGTTPQLNYLRLILEKSFFDGSHSALNIMILL